MDKEIERLKAEVKQHELEIKKHQDEIVKLILELKEKYGVEM